MDLFLGTDRTLVFVEKKRDADFLASFLSQRNYPTTSLNGYISPYIVWNKSKWSLWQDWNNCNCRSYLWRKLICQQPCNWLVSLRRSNQSNAWALTFDSSPQILPAVILTSEIRANYGKILFAQWFTVLHRKIMLEYQWIIHSDYLVETLLLFCRVVPLS